MPTRPNLLFIMCDQMQGRVLAPGSPCITPNLDRPAARGVWFPRAYTPNAVCSPARASLMTGLLPHNHGVLYVTHTVDNDQACLRTDKPHWAQRLVQAGYQTAYFGKWHIDHESRLQDYGWQTHVDEDTIAAQAGGHSWVTNQQNIPLSLSYTIKGPEGYADYMMYGVTPQPIEQRPAGQIVQMASAEMARLMQQPDPWCVFISTPEPHDPFICSEAAYRLYDPASLPMSASLEHDMADCPGLYRRSAQAWKGLTEEQKRQAAACYYASITELDGLFGGLLNQLEAAGKLDSTIIVLTSDHGELLGAHGMYCKNFSAFEEVYNVPLILAGPGIAQGEVSQARVGLQDVASTLLELAGLPTFDIPDSRSFAQLLSNPPKSTDDFSTGYAEYFGGRIHVTQRVAWNGDWKFVFNGFDLDEMYNLAEDPAEMHNLAGIEAYQPQARLLMQQIWQTARRTGDHALLKTNYPPFRFAVIGPEEK